MLFYPSASLFSRVVSRKAGHESHDEHAHRATNVSRGAAMFLASVVDFTGSPLDIECCPELARPGTVLSLHQHQRCHKPTAPRKVQTPSIPHPLPKGDPLTRVAGLLWGTLKAGAWQ